MKEIEALMVRCKKAEKRVIENEEIIMNIHESYNAEIKELQKNLESKERKAEDIVERWAMQIPSPHQQSVSRITTASSGYHGSPCNTEFFSRVEGRSEIISKPSTSPYMRLTEFVVSKEETVSHWNLNFLTSANIHNTLLEYRNEIEKISQIENDGWELLESIKVVSY